jgi:hypothetical protein
MDIDNYIADIVAENDNLYKVLVIKPTSIEHLCWKDPNYAKQIIDLDIFDTILINKNNFSELVSISFDINKYTDVKNLTVKNEIIFEEPNYVYDLLYVDLLKAPQHQTTINSVGSLLNINDEIVYSNALLFKNYIPTDSNEMSLCDMEKTDILHILNNRKENKIVIWEDEWREDTIIGNIEQCAKRFFGEDTYEKIEIGFLSHNINVWYCIDKTKLIGQEIGGNIVKGHIEKCFWFTMKTTEYRGNLTLDEVNKIIYLSKILTDYKTPTEYIEDSSDHLGRKIIYTKYKVLDLMYNKSKSSA